MRGVCVCAICVLLLALPVESFAQGSISICSFNIQFLGHYTIRDDTSLAEVVAEQDIVVVQELVAPPFDGTYPNGDAFSGDAEANEFFEAMASQGFAYVLSEEDTGTGNKIHNKGTATEWWVAFYKPDTVEVAQDLPHGFLDKDLADNPNFERVPYAFGFRAKGGGPDFVLVSVHLQPNSGETNKIRRLHELDTIARWINANDQVEKDFIILGDMNIEDCEELGEATPEGFVSLNSSCEATNTKIDKPFDHVMYRPNFTQFDVDSSYRFRVWNLIEAMRTRWDNSLGQYPGDPYDHRLFKQYYSDHAPVSFRILVGRDDDPG